ncbi:nitroreductase [Planosporangium thailandense]|uniref:Nitroreductase n=2 Tax=Planosporangium thailandense TaxID=765197 RepID=A0ABX0Y4K3_9ACTN|nr:nitroreductase [Planosporangium thailandense]
MIQFTEPRAARQQRPATRALAKAAVAAGRAPSIFNSQPWRWCIADDVAQLRADRDRQLTTVDPDGRLLTVSCGAALHHARTALAGVGFATHVDRLPDPGDPDLFARIRVVDAGEPQRAAVRLQLAMALRHTDRRPFADVEVPPPALRRLREAAEEQGAHLRILRPEDVVTLAAAAVAAAGTELTDPLYRAELSAWTGRPAGARDGIPPETAAHPEPRPVPLRNLDPGGVPDPATHDVVDRYACYAILYTDTDTPVDWLAAGEALSAVLLTATDERLAASPISDVIEVPAARRLLCDLLDGAGYPMVALRIGVPGDGPLAAAARRTGAEVVDVAT